jgi:tRNA-dihydrouridine synthase A
MIILNGGIETVHGAASLASEFDGVMLGRAAYGEPYLLASVDELLYGEDNTAPSREQAVALMSDYVKREFARGTRPHSITRHMLGLYHGAPGARAWRRFLSENASNARDDLLDRAATVMASRVMA